MSRLVPQVGHWYQDQLTNLLFEIVASDPDAGTVEVQFLDGEIAGYDLESWGELTLLPAAEPEDWRSAFELDDSLDFDPDGPPAQWGNPLARIEPETTLGIDDL